MINAFMKVIPAPPPPPPDRIVVVQMDPETAMRLMELTGRIGIASEQETSLVRPYYAASAELFYALNDALIKGGVTTIERRPAPIASIRLRVA